MFVMPARIDFEFKGCDVFQIEEVILTFGSRTAWTEDPLLTYKLFPRRRLRRGKQCDLLSTSDAFFTELQVDAPNRLWAVKTKPYQLRSGAGSSPPIRGVSSQGLFERVLRVLR